MIVNQIIEILSQTSKHERTNEQIEKLK